MVKPRLVQQLINSMVFPKNSGSLPIACTTITYTRYKTRRRAELSVVFGRSTVGHYRGTSINQSPVLSSNSINDSPKPFGNKSRRRGGVWSFSRSKRQTLGPPPTVQIFETANKPNTRLCCCCWLITGNSIPLAR